MALASTATAEVTTSPALALRSIKWLLLPADGSAHFGAEPLAVNAGCFETGATFGGETPSRVLVDAGGLRVGIDSGSVIARLVTTAGAVTLERGDAIRNGVVDLAFSWDRATAVLEVQGFEPVEVALPGEPTPSLGPLSAGGGGGDAVALEDWVVGCRQLFSDGFESGDVSAWNPEE